MFLTSKSIFHKLRKENKHRFHSLLHSIIHQLQNCWLQILQNWSWAVMRVLVVHLIKLWIIIVPKYDMKCDIEKQIFESGQDIDFVSRFKTVEKLSRFLDQIFEVLGSLSKTHCLDELLSNSLWDFCSSNVSNGLVPKYVSPSAFFLKSSVNFIWNEFMQFFNELWILNEKNVLRWCLNQDSYLVFTCKMRKLFESGVSTWRVHEQGN